MCKEEAGERGSEGGEEVWERVERGVSGSIRPNQGRGSGEMTAKKTLKHNHLRD